MPHSQKRGVINLGDREEIGEKMKQKGRKMQEGFKRGGRIPGSVSLLPSGPSVSAVVSLTMRT